MKPGSLHLVMLSRLGRNAGGRETWLYNFFPRLVALDPRFDVTIFGIRDAGAGPEPPELAQAFPPDAGPRVRIQQFTVTRARYPVFFQMLYRVWRYTKSPAFEPPEVVMGMGIWEVAMILAGGYAPSRKVIWLRSIFLDEKAARVPRMLRPALDRFITAMLRRADLLLANGEDIAKHYRARGLKVEVVENGIDCEPWQCAPPVLASPISVAFVGRLADVKGIREFLAAVQIIKTGPNADRFVFHTIGSGPGSDTPAFLACLDAGMLVAHGNRPHGDLPRITSGVDVCVALTKSGAGMGGGGTSNALFEQMAAGRVIVAWDNVIFRQVLDEESAYLVPQGSVDGLVSALYDILADRDEAARRASNALQAAQRFPMDRQVRRCHDLLRPVFNRFESPA